MRRKVGEEGKVVVSHEAQSGSLCCLLSFSEPLSDVFTSYFVSVLSVCLKRLATFVV